MTFEMKIKKKITKAVVSATVLVVYLYTHVYIHKIEAGRKSIPIPNRRLNLNSWFDFRTRSN